MDAKSILIEVAEAFAHAKLEAVMIGNAAAAIQGAPVTTMDIDFCIRETDETVPKLSIVASQLDAELINYGSFFQIQAPEKELFLDFICNVMGVKSFDDLMERSSKTSFDGCFNLNIASLEDIIKSKKLVGKDKDLAVLPILELTLKVKNEKEKRSSTEKNKA
jgi:hypothetical protein